MTHEAPDRDTTIADIVDRLSTRFPSYPQATIHEVVAQTYDEFGDARVRDFIEVLVEKQARKRLKQLSA